MEKKALNFSNTSKNSEFSFIKTGLEIGKMTTNPFSKFLIVLMLIIFGACGGTTYVPPQYKPVPSAVTKSGQSKYENTGNLVLRYGRCGLCKGTLTIDINGAQAKECDWDTIRYLDYYPVPAGGYKVRVSGSGICQNRNLRVSPELHLDGEPGTVDLLRISFECDGYIIEARKLIGSDASRILDDMRAGSTDFLAYWRLGNPY